jgi:large subunit ribosomal protein L9
MSKVVVLEKFKKNWEIGSVVNVKDGYARNFLIPMGKAKFATKLNLDEIKIIESNLLKKDEEVKLMANVKATAINKLKFVKEIAAKENGELYGSLNVSDIVLFLTENNISIEKKSIKLGGKIKTTGEYSIDIDLHPEINCALGIEILSPKTSS